MSGCSRQSPHEPVTLVFLDQQWSAGSFSREERRVQRFTRETGIHVKFLPSPESAQEQLALSEELLKRGAAGPDVYGIDVIWPGILGEYFIDLRPYFAGQVSAHFPVIWTSFLISDKLVAIPRTAGIGLLYYRTDLLHEYGYRSPPQTWDELEKMADRIQQGERSKGKKQFWGFVWQGAASEALTCDALEWQVSEGGGQIIEVDKTITVNNPGTIRAWQRAAHWVGSISPPSVVTYRELDALNLWLAGDAAFMRNWAGAVFDSQGQRSSIQDKFDVSLLPGGDAPGVSTLGGSGLAVSRSSAHRAEALQLIRFLSSRDAQLERSLAASETATRPEIYEIPEVLRAYPHFALLNQALRSGVVSRPSRVSGKKYEDVSNAYAKAVHSVLTGQKNASRAVADLESELVQITGFGTGRPQQDQRP